MSPDPHNRRIDARAKPMAQALARWLSRYGRLLVERELRYHILKADDEERLRLELERLLHLYGLRQMDEAARGTGAKLVPAKAIDDFLATKSMRITGIMAESRDAVREGIRVLMREALAEDPLPSAGEITRRIRRTYLGPADAVPFEISHERAALIARTEMVQAENTGIVEGYKATGVKQLEWLSYSDGASGDRHHERMNGKRVNLGDEFVTPLGNRLRYPGDPMAPIKETANCRCTVAPVFG